ncbi:MAG: ribbon-helix-helix domain-containing protein [Planctomycetota bacterium]
MKQGHRFFNLLLPFKTYEKLKLLSVETDKSVAEIVRQAIGLLLDKIDTNKTRNK